MFTTLAHHLGEAFLTEALHQLRKAAAAGMDEMTAAEYSQRTVFCSEWVHLGLQCANPRSRVTLPLVFSNLLLD